MKPQSIRAITIFTGLLFAMSALATDQERDLISFRGEKTFTLEQPLNEFLRRLDKLPRFDVHSTSNKKGYDAEWKLQDSKLYLASFAATKSGQAVSSTVLFPDRKLPIFADWYSGPMHIVSGKTTFSQGGWTFERVTALRITKGVVTATNEFRKVKESTLMR